MNTFPPPSKPANLRDSLHQHLHMYALAASAAGVSVLALVQPGEAEIIYTPAQVTIGPNQHYNLDLNNDGIVDFTIKNHTWNTTSGWYGNLFLRQPAGNAVAGHIVAYGFPWAYALRSGMIISKKDRHFTPGKASMAYSVYNWAGSWRAGSWGRGVSNRFLGLKFKIDGKVHYGWAQLSIEPASFTATLTGYAYETIPNKAIKAGQEQDSDASVDQPGPAALPNPAPSPATLGLLAKGAPALCIWRRNEDQSLVCDRKRGQP